MEFEMDEHRLRTGQNGELLTMSRLCNLDLEKKNFNACCSLRLQHFCPFHVCILSTPWHLIRHSNETWEMSICLIKLFFLISPTSIFGGVRMKLMIYWWKGWFWAWSNITRVLMKGRIAKMMLNGHELGLRGSVQVVIILVIGRLRLVIKRMNLGMIMIVIQRLRLAVGLQTTSENEGLCGK